MVLNVKGKAFRLRVADNQEGGLSCQCERKRKMWKTRISGEQTESAAINNGNIEI
jgi:hypothetical protein